MQSRKAVTDYKAIPGGFKKYNDGANKWPYVYTFPTLKKKSSRGNDMEWTIYIRAEPMPKNTKALYDVARVSECYYWTISLERGANGGTPRISEETHIKCGKNIGKANETNAFTQALSDTYSVYLSKLKKGYDGPGAKQMAKDQGYTRKPPMLLYRYEKYKHKIQWPAYIQRKRDGILYSMARNSQTGKAEIYSRSRFVFTNTSLQEKELQKIFDKYPNLELYGEAYEHGRSLQELSGIVRNENKENKLTIYIFDCVPDGKADTPYVKRWAFLKKLFVEFPNMKYLKKVKTYRVDNEEQMMKLYKRFMREGYEGGIYRNPVGVYKHSWTTSRSWEVLKIKPRKSDEFKVFGFKDGNGKNKGLVTFIMQTSDGKKFNAEPNMPEEIRRKLFKEFQNDFYYKDKMATIEYSELSDRGVPQQPKFVAVRDYE